MEAFHQRFARIGMTLRAPLLLDYGHIHDSTQEGENAIQCLRHSDTLAYIGPINSDVGLASEPILNQGGMASISPANTDSRLTDPQYRSEQEPDTYAHKLRYVTYYRTVTSDGYQALAAAAFLRQQLLGWTYYLVDDRTEYGSRLASAMRQHARTLHLEKVGVAHLDLSSTALTKTSTAALADQVAAISPDAVYCACAPQPGAYIARALHQQGFHGSFLGADAIHNAAWLSIAGSVNKVYATDPGIDDNRAAAWFRRAFIARFHAVTQLYDAYAYDAATAALRAIYAASVRHQLGGGVTEKRKIVVGFVARTCFRGATGMVSFDANGDTTNRKVSIYSAEQGSWHLRAAMQTGKQPRCP
jgi:branched-chain amino acid transport system substrate-binding protein